MFEIDVVNFCENNDDAKITWFSINEVCDCFPVFVYMYIVLTTMCSE